MLFRSIFFTLTYMSLAPFNKKNRLLGQACLDDRSGFPTWKMAELMILRDEYGYPPFPELSGDDASQICSYYLTQLPISCTRGYKLSKPLGSGAGGSVYIMCTEGEECVYAGKYIILQDEKAKAKFLNEVTLMRECAEAGIGMQIGRAHV